MSWASAYKEIERAAAENANISESDYIVDGLLYCGKCHTQKQTRITILGEERTPYCLCKCEEERRAREDELARRRDVARRVEKLRKHGFSDADMREWTFANDDHKNESLMRTAQLFVDNFAKMQEAGKGLLMYGGVGVGKTYAAASIANALVDKGIPCMVTNMSRLINAIGGMFEDKQEYIDSLNVFELLVIDDLATERDTGYVNEIVYNIIDSRYRSGKPTIITTNLTGAELRSTEIKKQRIYSRLLEMCIPVKCEGADRRKEKSKSDFEQYSTMLGLL